MENFQNKTAIITEADTAVGVAVARSFLKHGCKVVLIGRATEEIDIISRTYGFEKVLAIPLEASYLLTNSNNIVKQVVERFGAVDKLICCSRPMLKLQTESTDVETVKKAWNNQVLAPVQLMKACLQQLGKSRGSVVILSSFECVKPIGILQSLAAATRLQLTKLAAEELKHQNVRLNAVSPYGDQMKIIQPKSWTGWIYSQLFGPPLCRKALPEEIAELVVLLSSEAMSSVSGQNHFIDSGISLTCPVSYSPLLTLIANVSRVMVECQKSILRFFNWK